MQKLWRRNLYQGLLGVHLDRCKIYIPGVTKTLEYLLINLTKASLSGGDWSIHKHLD